MATHRSAYRLSSGIVGGRIGPNRVAILTTVGRASGRKRSAPVFAFEAGQTFIVVASNGGTARPPQWFANLIVTPDAWLEVGSRRLHVRPAVLDDDERASWWDRVAKSYPRYETYQWRTDRQIPIVRLTPIE